MRSRRSTRWFFLLFCLSIGLLLGVTAVIPTHADEQRAYSITPQGNDSNCDFIAVANGIQNIGGDGEGAYLLARTLIPQAGRDYKEVFYTLFGSQGSDQPFAPDNLGAAPEAFSGLYQALGYNAVAVAAPAGVIDLDFTRAIRDMLAAEPDRAFAHVWITPYDYDPMARVLSVEETGEQERMLYPYHEVVVMLASDPERFVVLDGLVGYPYELSLSDMAYLLRGFNSVIVVSRNDGSFEDHQRFQISREGQPYVVAPLGGPYLSFARTRFREAYQTWGRVIGQPLRVVERGRSTVLVPGEYVQYVGTYADGVTLAQLGSRMAEELLQAGLIAPETVTLSGSADLTNGILLWVEGQFGSDERFHQMFGRTITPEFWLSAEQMQAVLPASVTLASDSYAQPDGYIVVLTERAMIVWTPTCGAWLVPLGQVYYQQMHHRLGME